MKPWWKNQHGFGIGTPNGSRLRLYLYYSNAYRHSIEFGIGFGLFDAELTLWGKHS